MRPLRPRSLLLISLAMLLAVGNGASAATLPFPLPEPLSPNLVLLSTRVRLRSCPAGLLGRSAQGPPSKPPALVHPPPCAAAVNTSLTSQDLRCSGDRLKFESNAHPGAPLPVHGPPGPGWLTLTSTGAQDARRRQPGPAGSQQGAEHRTRPPEHRSAPAHRTAPLRSRYAPYPPHTPPEARCLPTKNCTSGDSCAQSHIPRTASARFLSVRAKCTPIPQPSHSQPPTAPTNPAQSCSAMEAEPGEAGHLGPDAGLELEEPQDESPRSTRRSAMATQPWPPRMPAST